jgi:hypothetical protein
VTEEAATALAVVEGADGLATRAAESAVPVVAAGGGAGAGMGANHRM